MLKCKLFSLIQFCLLGTFLVELHAQQEPLPTSTPLSLTVFQDVEPQPLNMREVVNRIPYPATAKEAGIEGLVQVLVWVDVYGNYMDHAVVSSPHTMLSQAVESYIHCLSFTPAFQNEEAVYSWRVLPFRFHLQKRMQPNNKRSFPMIICPDPVRPKDKLIVTY